VHQRDIARTDDLPDLEIEYSLRSGNGANSCLVFAGSLKGGEIEKAVCEVRQQGLLVVVSLNMAGSVPDAADLVVTDPVQAGVMTVMAVSDRAKFTVDRLKSRVF
jgi:energy-converting hydrogenase B subunit Q